MKVVVCLRGAGADPRSQACNAEPLALALGLRPTHQVIALLPDSVGALRQLQEAVAAGVTRAVRLIDDQLSPSDFHSMGQLMANAIRRLDGDLVLMGTPFDDEGVGAMSASLAKHLGIIHVGRVEALGAGPDDRTVEVTVRGGGRKRRLTVSAPAVLSVVGAPEAALAAAAAGQAGDESPTVETISLTDPEATVVRRRSEHLGRPEIAARPARKAGSATELMRLLKATEV